MSVRHSSQFIFKTSQGRSKKLGKGQLKCDGTCAETKFRLSAERTSPFKSAGASVQSTTGSRGVRISGSNTPCSEVVWRVLASFPSTPPSRASPCAITFQLESTECQYYSCGKKPPRSHQRTNITVSNMIAFVAVYLILWEEILMLVSPHMCITLVLCLKLNQAS
jgi:hypothetical protein